MDDKPSGLFPKVPTLKAATGSKWVHGVWRGVGAPKNLPKPIEDRLVIAVKKAYDSRDFKDFMASRGFGVVWADPQETAKFMAASDANLGAALKAVGLAK